MQIIETLILRRVVILYDDFHDVKIDDDNDDDDDENDDGDDDDDVKP